MGDALRFEELTKFYGRHRGVVELSLEVAPGEVFGFLGPNGAGKTTTIRVLLDLIRPTSGAVRVLGLDAQRDGVEVRRRVGYLPGELALSERLTPREQLAYFARLRGGVDPTRISALAERFELELHRPIRDLSRGTKQKVGIVQAFAHRPELLVLDEPTAGLDPLMQQTFNELLRETAAGGGTVFLSSHVLSEVQHVADRVGIIREGRLVAIEDVASLHGKAVRHLEVRFAGAPPAEELRAVPGVREATVDGLEAHLVAEGSLDALVKALAAHEVVDLRSREPDLEEIFLAHYDRRPNDA
jgi:ABC-2 type transport system ATP-binding protein